MPSEGLFSATYARGGAAAQSGDAAWLQALLDVEAALARACASEELIPAHAAEAIAAACRPERFDAAAIGREGGEHASVVVPLVRALREAVGDKLAGYVHLGATSQDILDTAQMLVARRALAPVLGDAESAADAAARLADAHRDTAMTARTLLQAALPTSFGLRAAGWLTGIDEARRRLEAARVRELAVQMGGPVGNRDPAIAARVAAELGLAEPTLPWHANRGRVASLAAALGILAGALAKIARDVTLLAADEVGEVREGGPAGRGASSAMAHKRNPVAAVSVLACARRVPGLVTTLVAGMEQEHERAAGAWQAEWGTVSELLTLTGSAAAWARDLLEHLEVNPDRMRARVAAPEADLGAASELIDRALAAHRS
ncbi:MAG TPA: lyase family protein [Solirubrobacteraceae bacterium]|nr:lyase family protein [Solirubrobacteraceae bacterium]